MRTMQTFYFPPALRFTTLNTGGSMKQFLFLGFGLLSAFGYGESAVIMKKASVPACHQYPNTALVGAFKMTEIEAQKDCLSFPVLKSLVAEIGEFAVPCSPVTVTAEFNCTTLR